MALVRHRHMRSRRARTLAQFRVLFRYVVRTPTGPPSSRFPSTWYARNWPWPRLDREVPLCRPRTALRCARPRHPRRRRLRRRRTLPPPCSSGRVLGPRVRCRRASLRGVPRALHRGARSKRLRDPRSVAANSRRATKKSLTDCLGRKSELHLQQRAAIFITTRTGIRVASGYNKSTQATQCQRCLPYLYQTTLHDWHNHSRSELPNPSSPGDDHR
jgi:hypothetical protein